MLSDLTGGLGGGTLRGVRGAARILLRMGALFPAFVSCSGDAGSQADDLATCESYCEHLAHCAGWDESECLSTCCGIVAFYREEFVEWTYRCEPALACFEALPEECRARGWEPTRLGSEFYDSCVDHVDVCDDAVDTEQRQRDLDLCKFGAWSTDTAIVAQEPCIEAECGPLRACLEEAYERVAAEACD